MNVFTFIIALVGMVFGFITWWIKLGIARSSDDGDSGRKRRRRRQRDAGDPDLDALAAMAGSLTERIEVLESILDAEVPDWREQHERTE